MQNMRSPRKDGLTINNYHVHYLAAGERHLGEVFLDVRVQAVVLGELRHHEVPVQHQPVADVGVEVDA